MTLKEIDELKIRLGKKHEDYNFLNMMSIYGKTIWPVGARNMKRLKEIQEKNTVDNTCKS